jgi:hypothetical protein
MAKKKLRRSKCGKPGHNKTTCKKRGSSKKRSSKKRAKRSKKRRNPRRKASKLNPGDKVWVISNQRVLSAEVTGTGVRDSTVYLTVQGPRGSYNSTAKAKNVYKTKAKAEAAGSRKKRISKLWATDIKRKEAEELLALEHDYNVVFFSPVDLWKDGYDCHQSVKALSSELGIPMETDEGHIGGSSGITINVVLESIRTKSEAKKQAKKLLKTLNSSLDSKWSIAELDIASKVRRAMHEDELEELYGNQAGPLRRRRSRRNPRRRNPCRTCGCNCRDIITDTTRHATSPISSARRNPRKLSSAGVFRSIKSWCLDKGIDADELNEIQYYTPKQWKALGWDFGNDAKFSLNIGEGTSLSGLISNWHWYHDSEPQLLVEFDAYIESLGYWYDIGDTWSLHFYAI